MQPFFITATGTEIGKTFVTTSLIWQLHQKGYDAVGLKPVISGLEEPKEDDITLLLKAMNKEDNQDNRMGINAFGFQLPLSPDQAAEREGKSIKFERLVNFCQERREADYVFIEGVGGVMVPLTENKTTLDWVDALNIPAIVVAGSYLGSLSHTLTAIEVLKSRNIAIAGLVINQSYGAMDMGIKQTVASLRRFVNCPIVISERIEPSNEYWCKADDLTALVER